MANPRASSLTPGDATPLVVEFVDIDTLKPHPRNARNGDTDLILESIQQRGVYKPIIIAKDGTILAGNHTYAAAMEQGIKNLSVIRHDLDPDSPAALGIMLADNRTADQGRYDNALLLDLVKQMDETTGLAGTGFTADDLDHLIHLVEDFHDAPVPKARPEPRTSPLDLIWSAADPYTSMLAHLFGWGQGYISTSLPTAWDSLTDITTRMVKKPTLDFIDNEWHGYDHEKHMAAVAAHHPKYATVRDVLTKTQCEEAGVEYFTVPEVIQQARDCAAAGAANVIIIPKFNCLDDLPGDVDGVPIVLGYSVPSSYGRTNLDPALFAGRPIHLLGGSWGTQRSLCALLGTDVVSLDNNYLMKQAKFGSYAVGDQTKDLFETTGARVIRGLPVLTAAISMAACFADAYSWGGTTDEADNYVIQDDPEEER